MGKLAIFSPVIPPVRSGQAIILYRLLEGRDPSSYVFIADSRIQNKNAAIVATTPLSAKTFFLDKVTSQPAPLPGRRRVLTTPFFLLREVEARARKILKILRDNDIDILVGCTGDFYGFAAAALAAKLAGCKFVAYLFDDYLYQSPGYLRPVSWVIERSVLRSAAAVIVTNSFFRQLLERRHGTQAHVVHNAINLDECVPDSAIAPPFSSQTQNIVFAGTIYNAHYDAFHRLLAAIAQLERKDVRLHLFTYQKPAELAAVGISGPMIVHHGFRPQREVLAAQSHADLLFLPLAFSSAIGPLLRTAAPGKTAEYLALGKPVLVHAPAESFVSWYFREHQCGIVVDSPDTSELVRGVEEGLFNQTRREQIANNARRQAQEDFDVAKAKEKFDQVLSKVRGRP